MSDANYIAPDRRTLRGRISSAIKSARGTRPVEEVARLAEVNPRQWYSYETGGAQSGPWKRIPTIEVLVRMARAMGTTVSELLRDVR